MTANDVDFGAVGVDFGGAVISNEVTGVAVWIVETPFRTWEAECCGLIETFGTFDNAFEWAMLLTAPLVEEIGNK